VFDDFQFERGLAWGPGNRFGARPPIRALTPLDSNEAEMTDDLFDDEDDDAITADDLKTAVERHAAAVVNRNPPRFLTTDERDNMLDLLTQLIAADPTFLPSLPAHAQHLVRQLLPHLRPGHGIH
jgi:hypothetical protein